MISSFFATSQRRAPSTERTSDFFLSATTRTTSPFSAPALPRIAVISSSVMNFANDDAIPSSVILIHARPFAPKPLAVSVSLSISFLVSLLTAFFALIALTVPPASSADLNTTNSLFATSSERSKSSISKRVSGLSEPYLSIASLYVSLGSFSGISTLIASLKTLWMYFSIISRTSSTSTKDISRSICVNSGCLSALRSSSRKHLAIWMYLSKPATIESCL